MGKSAAAFFFSRLGVPVIDADMIAREMTEIDKPVFKKIIDELGIGFVKSDGTLDRKKLCETIFRDEKIKRRLEGLLHPAIYRRLTGKSPPLITPIA